MFADDGSYSIIRGDADTIVVKLFEDTEQKTPYNPVAADVIDFTVKKSTEESMATAKVKKSTKDGSITVTDNAVTIPIKPADTESLEYGTYKFDVQITFGGDKEKIKTVVGPLDFNVTEEVTTSE